MVKKNKVIYDVFLLVLLALIVFTRVLLICKEQKTLENCKTNFEQKVPLSGKQDKCFKYYNCFLKEKQKKENKEKFLKENKLIQK